MPKATVGDLEIAYDLIGSGPPVVLINGIGSPRSGWSMQADVLAEYFTVLTFDNRDVGETGAGSNPQPYRMQQFAVDLAGLLDVAADEGRGDGQAGVRLPAMVEAQHIRAAIEEWPIDVGHHRAEVVRAERTLQPQRAEAAGSARLGPSPAEPRLR